MDTFRADLHIHSCLSPCCDLRMSPKNITATALSQKLDLIAICDHNSAGNSVAVQCAARTTPLQVLAGLEICTREEVHLLALFEDSTQAIDVQSWVLHHLTGMNDPDIFGMQILVNEMDEILGYEPKLLIGATDLSIDAVVEVIHQCGGIAIASHIDREHYGIFGQLGFIPDSVRFDALELSPTMSIEEARSRFCLDPTISVIHNSDAHALDTIGRNYSTYLLQEPSFRELSLALNNKEGRFVIES